MARSIVYGIAVLLMLGPAVSANRAQDSLLQEMYGQGVHAYFAGKYDHAHELFTTAIDQGSQDPRCYYFRGLAYAKLGRPDEADADYKHGAELEAGGAAVQINVGQALQRVQGNLRLQLEEYRYSARLAARLKEVKEKKERYEQMQRNEPNVLRGGAPPAAASGTPQPPAPDATDPFAAGAGAAPAPAASETPAAAPAGADPLAAPAGPAAPAAEDPFAEPSQPVQMPAEGAAPEAPAAADPFGAAMPAAPAAADPFGAAAPAAPAAAPAGEAAPAAADPFGAAAPARRCPRWRSCPGGC